MLKKAIRILIVLIMMAALGFGGVLLVKHKKKALAAAPKYGMQPMPVRAAPARLGDLRRMRDYLAVVEPIRVADVSARVTASVEKVLRDENEWVKTGDVLVTLDSRQIEESIAAMKAQVEQAQADLASNQATVDSLARTVAYWDREAQRDEALADKGAIPGAQAEGTSDKANEARGKLDAARQKSAAIERSIESLQRRQAELETTLSYCTIRSPFDGIISHRRVDPGDLAVPGKSLMVVEDRSQLRLAFDVPQQDLPEVREGLAVEYSAARQNHEVTLSHLFPSLNAARMLRAEVYLSGREMDGLSPGAYVPLRVVLGNDKDVTLVPGTAVVESPDGHAHVFVVRDHHLEARPVNLLGSSGDDVAVDGIQAGEQVVLSTFLGWAQLASGQIVEAIQ
ncbi:MAG TPA: efflux RND transporter periplasmic adaptor subunit [Sedimentisphaerales bacterium]|nr:efflux RND transporter periplasmic adaptor subunit [Sedimentisphaerales bacterium]HRS12569.1 efflux RND transporter periplasmic adaptor subunit [Sedimentisphaerales bacterium]HRV49183.1 efflux RND transporter periplasmic adaptor subunit [Sedimentisphaerales bacterium]